MAKHDGAGRGGRFSALWGTKRDGSSKGSALWGNGGRGGAVLLIGLLALVVPLTAASHTSTQASSTGEVSALIPDALLSQAQSNPGQTFRVIVQGEPEQDNVQIAEKVATLAARSDEKLMGAAREADAASARAENTADRLAAEAAKAAEDAALARGAAGAKATRAKATGRRADRNAAAQAADDAARKARDAAQVRQNAATATAASLAATGKAEAAHGDVSRLSDSILEQKITDRFPSIAGLAVELTGEQVVGLAAHGDDGVLAITPDALVVAAAAQRSPWSSDQDWPYASGAAGNWAEDANRTVQANMPAIAIVDSGIEDRADFDGRIVASVDLSTLPNDSPGDGRGHGTFVAGIAAGSADGYAGAAPAAKLVSIDVLDDSGMGRTSDVIRACQWILDNKAKYHIRVANFSLHSQITAPFYLDPLDRAIEQLWFNGVVVVVAAGNYGTPDEPSGVLYSPSDDPFVITVGAVDLGSQSRLADDRIAPWSSWGSTIDGFAKPELSAPGRYMVGPVPSDSTLAAERPVASPGYMQLSGTSFAAAIVSGAAADVLARHPEFTPDQVKGSLMVTARSMDGSVGLAGGVGEIAADAAANDSDPPNPNAAIATFVRSTWAGTRVFDAFSWNRAARANASWNSASWNSASWNSASWNSASWNSASWNSASWNSASWNSASWNSASWNSASWNSIALVDAADRDGLSR